MKLKEVNYNLKRRNIIFILLVCVIAFGSIVVQAASKHTTMPSLTIKSGNGNPFKHDSATCTVSYCTYHPHVVIKGKSSDLNASKVCITLEVKSSAKNTKTVSTKYESAGLMGLAYCDWNKGSKTLTAKTAEADKYNIKARYKTKDFFCTTCLARNVNNPEKYSNITSGWKVETKK